MNKQLLERRIYGYFGINFRRTQFVDHPNVKLFLTQGGLQSSEEAILAEVPIIGFPTHSDQTVNVDTFVTYGAGIGLDLEYLTAEQLNSSVHEIMTDPR